MSEHIRDILLNEQEHQIDLATGARRGSAEHDRLIPPSLGPITTSFGEADSGSRAAPMLAIESVSKRFRSGHYGVRDLSLAVAGGVLGLLGPNGAGKTTLMQMIATITRPTAGRILFDGHDIARGPTGCARGLAICRRTSGSTTT